jgi:hypothetical protein
MKKTHVIRARKGPKVVAEYTHLDVQSREEFMYLLHLREHHGIHYKELNELSQLIYTELLENKSVVRVGERIYKPFLGTAAPHYLQMLWDAT